MEQDDEPKPPTDPTSANRIEPTPEQQARLDRLLADWRGDPERPTNGRRPVRTRTEYWTDTNGDRYVNVKGRARLIECGR
jgi:hypothetical protein